MKSKTVIYQAFTRLFGNTNSNNIPQGSLAENGVGKMADFTPKALAAIKSLGTTHLWFTGIIEHATQTDYSSFGIIKDHPAVVKGKAGSPYAIKDYYDVDPDLARNPKTRLKEFDQLVARTHKAGLKVVIDFVPNHVARGYYSDQQPQDIPMLGAEDNTHVEFDANNNFYYIPNQPFEGQFDLISTADEPYREYPAKATGNDQFHAYPSINDWYETIKLNYGVNYKDGSTHFYPTPQTWHQMLHILEYWIQKGVDGFRCDMAEMVPVEFWHWAIDQIKKRHNDILFIAEVYNPSLYESYLLHGHFDYLYDKVGLYDTLKAVVRHEAPAYHLSYCWQSLGEMQPRMLNFLENHDEQRIASKYYAGEAQKGIPALIVSAMMNTNPFMLYNGQELGESARYTEGFSGDDGRTTIFDYWCVKSLKRWSDGGKYDGAALTEQEQSILQQYRQIMQIVQSEPAISEGLFYDLAYCNHDYLPTDRVYPMLRKSDRSILLIVANFDSGALRCQVNIPREALEYLQLPTYLTEATELLSGETIKASLSADQPLDITLKGHSGAILKFCW